MALGDFICCMEACPWKDSAEAAATGASCGRLHSEAVSIGSHRRRRRPSALRKSARSRVARKAAHAAARAA